MFFQIKNRIDQELGRFVKHLDTSYALSSLSGLLAQGIKEFFLREGKRIRPILFVVGYQGFSHKSPPGLYTSALAIELLHDFMLIHDDIIDKSATRRGKPSLHTFFNNHFRYLKNRKFTGQDLAIVVGDVMYAMAIDAFLTIQEEPLRKEKALRKFIQAAAFTGCGEFIELVDGLRPIEKITKQDIYKIYDYKTAFYTFSTPLATGAILAGAPDTEVDKLFKFGLYVGRAFQIKDDILGMFGDEAKIGKSTLTDLQEAKKTILIWHGYQRASKKDKASMNDVFSKKKVGKRQLHTMRRILKNSGALHSTRKEVTTLLKKSETYLGASKIRPKHKNALCTYAQSILKI